MTSSDQPNVEARAADAPPLQRAKEAEDLLTVVQQLVTSFIQAADDNASTKSQSTNHNESAVEARPVLLEQHSPEELQQLLDFSLPETGLGKDGFIQMVRKIFQYSVNTWDQGFLDKLYAATTPVGLAADLVLSALNTNAHVYQVSPALTIIEKQTGKALAERFGFTSPHAGGITQPGGSAANQSSIVIARNNLFPETKTEGNGGRRFVLFTSAHGHYSVEKAAQMFGFGSKGVRTVTVDEHGRMQPAALDEAIHTAKNAGETPFYVNATAGTTVLGSFDPIDEIASVCRKHNLWLHVDGSWGGSVVFSPSHRHKLHGIDKADSISICPHKMLNVPLTCSFLIGKDLRQFHKGMTLPAGYLFHNTTNNNTTLPTNNPLFPTTDFNDLADLTPQCGRRADSLKLALTCLYHGTASFTTHIDRAFSTTTHLASLIASHPSLTLVSQIPPPCLQVCFYYAKTQDRNRNTRMTEGIAGRLVGRGYLVDFAEVDAAQGCFLRVVVNGQTRWETVEGLVRAVEEVGREVVREEGKEEEEEEEM